MDGFPYAIVFDNEFLVTGSPFNKQFVFLHEAGHVKSCYLGIHALSSKELREVIADTYALDFFVRNTKKDDFNNLIKNIESPYSKPYLNYQELVYHAKKLFDMQQGANKLDVPTYAKKIVAWRRKNGYEQEVRQGAGKLLNSIYDSENNPKVISSDTQAGIGTEFAKKLVGGGVGIGVLQTIEKRSAKKIITTGLGGSLGVILTLCITMGYFEVDNKIALLILSTIGGAAGAIVVEQIAKKCYQKEKTSS